MPRISFVFFITAAFCTGIVHAAEPERSSELESLFGSSVKTPAGTIQIRQKTDERGRVRRQILVGANFSELQIDGDGDGTVDLWEIARGRLRVSASQPSQGRFLRLDISDHQPNGVTESVYLLSLDGRSYNRLRSEFTPRGRMLWSQSDADTAAGRVPSTFEATDVPEPAVTANDNRDRHDRQSSLFKLEETGWAEHQRKLGVSDQVCDDDTMGVAAIQTDWWRILKRQSDDNAAKLASYLRGSPMFGDSCKKNPARKKDFDKVVSTISNIMLTSSKGTPSATERSRGRFLRCLEQSGLGVAAARMEQYFLTSTAPGQIRSGAAIQCDWKPGKAGISKPAVFDFAGSRQVSLFMTAADEGKGKAGYGVVQNYQNVLFHEFVHAAGIKSEETVEAVVGCCGDPVGDREANCRALDLMVNDEIRYKQLETHLARVRSEQDTFVWSLDRIFGAEKAFDVSRNFMLSLDKELGYTIFNNREFSFCVQEKRESQCRSDWTAKIRKFADTYFEKKCQLLESGAYKKQCRSTGADVKDQIAQAIASSMLVVNLDGICPPAFAPPRKSAWRINLDAAAALLLRGLSEAAAAAEETKACDGTGFIAIPPAPPALATRAGDPGEVAPRPDLAAGIDPVEMNAKSPTVSVPGRFVGDSVVTGGRSRDADVQPSRPRSPTDAASPLPVTRVDFGNEETADFATARYRRATDIIGRVARSVDSIRDGVVPAAYAGGRSPAEAPGTRRLTANEPFVAFRPTDLDSAKPIRLTNPFADASALAGEGSGGPAAVAKAVGSANAPSEPAGSLEAGEGEKSGLGKKVSRSQSGEKDSSKPLAAARAMAVAPSVGGLSAKSAPTKGRDQADVLSGLFTEKYIDVEPRLRELAVVEALIRRKISVLDAGGRWHGASRDAAIRYRFNGQQRPLLRDQTPVNAAKGSAE